MKKAYNQEVQSQLREDGWVSQDNVIRALKEINRAVKYDWEKREIHNLIDECITLVGDGKSIGRIF